MTADATETTLDTHTHGARIIISYIGVRSRSCVFFPYFHTIRILRSVWTLCIGMYILYYTHIIWVGTIIIFKLPPPLPPPPTTK